MGKLTLVKEYARWYHKPGRFKYTSSKAMVCKTCSVKYADVIKNL